MYVWTYVCMCVCMYACVYLCVHACLHACMHAYMFVCFLSMSTNRLAQNMCAHACALRLYSAVLRFPLCILRVKRVAWFAKGSPEHEVLFCAFRVARGCATWHVRCLVLDGPLPSSLLSLFILSCKSNDSNQMVNRRLFKGSQWAYCVVLSDTRSRRHRASTSGGRRDVLSYRRPTVMARYQKLEVATGSTMMDKFKPQYLGLDGLHPRAAEGTALKGHSAAERCEAVIVIRQRCPGGAGSATWRGEYSYRTTTPTSRCVVGLSSSTTSCAPGTCHRS